MSAAMRLETQQACCVASTRDVQPVQSVDCTCTLPHLTDVIQRVDEMRIALLTLLLGLFCLPAFVSLCLRPLLCSILLGSRTRVTVFVCRRVGVDKHRALRYAHLWSLSSNQRFSYLFGGTVGGTN